MLKSDLHIAPLFYPPKFTWKARFLAIIRYLLNDGWTRGVNFGYYQLKVCPLLITVVERTHVGMERERCNLSETRTFEERRLVAPDITERSRTWSPVGA